MGGHEHEDLPHYHLLVNFPGGKSKELIELFERSHLERKVESGKVSDLIFIIENDMKTNGIYKPFTLFWKGKKLDNPNIKLRQIVVDKTKLPLYHQNIDNPIVIVYNDDIGDPIYFESHDLDLADIRAPQTPRKAK